MESIQAIFQQLSGMLWSDYLDIILVAFLIYKIIPMIRSTGTGRVAKVVVAILILAWLTGVLKLHTINFIINLFLEVGLIALVVLFQPELRRLLEQLGNVKIQKLFNQQKVDQEMENIIVQTVRACEIMSRDRVGALIVFSRETVLDDYVKTGTRIDGEVSEQLIRNIFFPKASLHDGAMVICDGRVTAAGCVLPLSQSTRLSADLGTRHRAGVGISEISDAVVVIVSEETGAVSVAVGGMLKRHLAFETLEKLLRNELCPEEENPQEENKLLLLKQKLLKKGKGEEKNEEE